MNVVAIQESLLRAHADGRADKWHWPTAFDDANEGHPGPELPDVEPGLPRTDMKSIHRLFTAVLVRGVLDDATGEWVGGRDYHRVCELAGLERWQAMSLRDSYRAKTLDKKQLKYIFCGLTSHQGAAEPTEPAERSRRAA